MKPLRQRKDCRGDCIGESTLEMSAMARGRSTSGQQTQMLSKRLVFMASGSENGSLTPLEVRFFRSSRNVGATRSIVARLRAAIFMRRFWIKASPTSTSFGDSWVIATEPANENNSLRMRAAKDRTYIAGA